MNIAQFIVGHPNRKLPKSGLNANAGVEYLKQMTDSFQPFRIGEQVNAFGRIHMPCAGNSLASHTMKIKKNTGVTLARSFVLENASQTKAVFARDVT